MQSFRRLPHVHPPGAWLFVTWHLHGSLPHGLHPPPGKLNAGQAFVWMDRHLDAVTTGPTYLAQRPVAQVVVDSLEKGVQLGHFDLHAFVIMANHVHVLLLPKVPVSKLLRALKGSSARQANLLPNRTGESFWQAESYDHYVRDRAEFERIANYIEQNPVKAGLARKADDFRWSSASIKVASVGTSADAAGAGARATS